MSDALLSAVRRARRLLSLSLERGGVFFALYTVNGEEVRARTRAGKPTGYARVLAKGLRRTGEVYVLDAPLVFPTARSSWGVVGGLRVFSSARAEEDLLAVDLEQPKRIAKGDTPSFARGSVEVMP
jgi:hypothetical protein